MQASHRRVRVTSSLAAVALTGLTVAAVPVATADNARLNESVIGNVYGIRQQHGCPGDVNSNPALQQAARWHVDDILTNRQLDGDAGSDGSTPQQRADKAGFKGVVAETVAVNHALAINSVEVINQWYERPDYLAIMSDCANTQMGVWSENRLNRTVVVAVYGRPTP